MKPYLLLFTAFLLVISASNAQNGLNLPEVNAPLAKEKYALLSDNLNSGSYKEAYGALQWLLKYAPDMHETVYVFGQKTIKHLIELNDQDLTLVDSLMTLYDMRITYFGKEMEVLNRKAFDAYKYLRNDTDHLTVLAGVFDQLYDISGKEMKSGLLYPYFDIKASQRKSNIIDDEQLIHSYQNISEIVQYKMEFGETNLEKTTKLIDATLVNTISFSCITIKTWFVDESGIDMSDVQRAKLILNLSVAYKCQQAPYFMDAIRVLYGADSSKTKLGRILALHFMENHEFEKALKIHEKNLELSTNQPDKANIYFDLASVYYAQKHKQKAREMAYHALKIDPSRLDCYRLIGDLYYTSFDECKKGKSRVEDRSVFYAAFDKYNRAKEAEKMAMAEQQFPTMEEIHLESFVEGQTITTPCWMNESIRIRRRPKLTSN